MNKNQVLIIIPAYNEEKNIEKVVNNLVINYPEYDYVVVNDGSKDNTVAVCELNQFNLLNLPVNLGLSGAVQTGIRYAYENNYHMALQLDGDGQHNPYYIKKMIACMDSRNADIVIASRYLELGKYKGSFRLLGGKIIGACIKLTTGKTITDSTSGMRLYNHRLMKEFAYVMNYTPEPDTISFLIKNKVKVVEVQVEMSDRAEGESYLNLKNAIRYMIHMSISIILLQPFRKRGN